MRGRFSRISKTAIWLVEPGAEAVTVAFSAVTVTLAGRSVIHLLPMELPLARDVHFPAAINGPCLAAVQWQLLVSIMKGKTVERGKTSGRPLVCGG